MDLREASFLGDVVHLTGHCVDDGITCPLGPVTARSDSPAALSGEVDVVVRPEDLTLTDSPGCPHGSVQGDQLPRRPRPRPGRPRTTAPP
ncbi:hypothetical protein LP422_05035 [Janibacter limosus]|uniref:Uncharacterized protein n=1 Tax=Janibacter limosus TaxID=53458 RepID=A0AC61U622_9MICO|nr:hypothetical protein [Janibacter limosus]UUZ45485.1 hypothetical protein LP422_05035 [Janibacter limosus]